ncbi:BON domain-containing protein [Gemmata sp. JC673]|uniref:BON domain-containing protein n=1 Tax=Gemmata algarum TaxID=2975278 RepID=A0ABU5F9C0_9BACT|nr:BON domain-containing protein [Gemmata algarum]MDY3563794.1 BON domain-containing protein [Gemmata algarum]
MSGLKAWACAVVFAASAAPAFAQISGGSGLTGGTGSTGTTRTTTGTGSISSGSTSGTSTSGTGSTSGSSTADALNSNALESLQQQNLQFTDIGITTGTSTLQKSNVFSTFYGNPYALGISSTSGGGGFGSPLFGTTTTNTTGRTTTTTGRTTGRTGTTGSTQSGILIPLPVQINYTAQLQFPAAPVAAPRLNAELRGAIDTGGLANPTSVQVVADANNNVTLRGTVRDDDEKRLAEGLIRLTPGVRAITNELTYPVAPK